MRGKEGNSIRVVMSQKWVMISGAGTDGSARAGASGSMSNEARAPPPMPHSVSVMVVA